MRSTNLQSEPLWYSEDLPAEILLPQGRRANLCDLSSCCNATASPGPSFPFDHYVFLTLTSLQRSRVYNSSKNVDRAAISGLILYLLHNSCVLWYERFNFFPKQADLYSALTHPTGGEVKANKREELPHKRCVHRQVQRLCVDRRPAVHLEKVRPHVAVKQDVVTWCQGFKLSLFFFSPSSL